MFLDHPIGTGKEEINSERTSKVLDKDEKQAPTVTLNLKNLMTRAGDSREMDEVE